MWSLPLVGQGTHHKLQQAPWHGAGSTQAHHPLQAVAYSPGHHSLSQDSQTNLDICLPELSWPNHFGYKAFFCKLNKQLWLEVAMQAKFAPNELVTSPFLVRHPGRWGVRGLLLLLGSIIPRIPAALLYSFQNINSTNLQDLFCSVDNSSANCEMPILTHVFTQEAHGQLVRQHLWWKLDAVPWTANRLASSCRSEQIALDKNANL